MGFFDDYPGDSRRQRSGGFFDDYPGSTGFFGDYPSQSDAASGMDPDEWLAEEPQNILERLLTQPGKKAALDAPRAGGEAALWLQRLTNPAVMFTGQEAEQREQLHQMTEPLAEISEAVPVERGHNLVERGIQAAVQSSPQMAATIASGPFAPFTAAGIAGSASEQEALERGVGPTGAVLKGLASGALVAPLETIGARGVAGLLKKLPAGKRIGEMRRIFTAAGREAGTEVLQEAVEMVLEHETGKDISMAEVLERLPVAAIAGGATAGAARGIGVTYEAVRSRVAPEIRARIEDELRQPHWSPEERADMLWASDPDVEFFYRGDTRPGEEGAEFNLAPNKQRPGDLQEVIDEHRGSVLYLTSQPATASTYAATDPNAPPVEGQPARTTRFGVKGRFLNLRGVAAERRVKVAKLRSLEKDAAELSWAVHDEGAKTGVPQGKALTPLYREMVEVERQAEALRQELAQSPGDDAASADASFIGDVKAKLLDAGLLPRDLAEIDAALQASGRVDPDFIPPEGRQTSNAFEIDAETGQTVRQIPSFSMDSRQTFNLFRDLALPVIKRKLQALDYDGVRFDEGGQDNLVIFDRSKSARKVSFGFTASERQMGELQRGLRKGEAGAINAADAARVGQGLGSAFRRFMTTRRGLPEREFQLAEEMEGMVEATKYQAVDRADRAARAREAVAKGDPAANVALADAWHRYVIDPEYREGEGQNLPAEYRQTAQEAREHVDAMAMALVQSGALTPEQEAIVGQVLENGNQRGLGRYLHRTFMAHEDPRGQFAMIGGNRRTWAPPTPETMTPEWQGARDYFSEQPDMKRRLEGLPDAERQSLIDNEIIAMFRSIETERRGGDPLSSSDRFGKISRTALTRRSDLDPRLLDVLGEKKGELAYLDTISTMSQMIGKNKFYTAILQGPLGHLFHVAPPPGDTQNYDRLRDSTSSTAQEIIALAAGLPAGAAKQPFSPLGRRVRPKGDIRQFEIPGVEGKVTLGQLNGMKKAELQKILEDFGSDEIDGTRPQLVEKIVDAATTNGRPVDELYVHKNLMETFDNAFMAANPLARALESASSIPIVGGVLSVLLRGSGVAKASLTVYKPQAQIRNFFSNPLAVIASGGLPLSPAAWKGAWKRTGGMIRAGAKKGGRLNAAEQAELERRIGLGIYTPNVDVADTEAYIGNATRRFIGRSDQIMENLRDKGPLGKAVAAVASLPAGYLKVMPRFYQGGDNFWKDIAFTFERAQLGKMKPEADPDALDREAAELVKQTIQNYNRIPRAIEELRIFPAMGPFVSFPTAVAINIKNQAKRSAQELGLHPPDEGSTLTPGFGKDLRQTRRGLRRIGFLAGALHSGSQATGYVIGAIANLASPLLDFIAGSEDDEDQELLEDDYKMGGPPWTQNSKIKVLGKSKTEAGVGYYADLSYSDYFGSFTKPVMAFLNSGKYNENAFMAAATEALTPYFSADVFFGTLMELWNNEDQYGRKIYLKREGLLDSSKKIATHLILGTNGVADVAWRFAHGLLDKPDSRNRTFDFATEGFAQFTGIRVSKVDFGSQVAHKANHAAFVLQEIHQAISAKLIVPEEIPVEDAQHTAAFHRDAVIFSLSQAARMTEIAQRRGVSRTRALTTFTNSQLPKNVARPLLAGIPAEKVAARWLRSRYELVNKHRRTRYEEQLRRFRDRNLRGPDAERLEEERLREIWAPVDLSFFREGD